MNFALAIRAALPELVGFCVRRRLLVIATAVLLCGLSLYAASLRLGVTTDTSRMFSDSLPWKRASQAMDKLFPQNTSLLVAVVDAQIPEEAEVTANALARALQADTAHFHGATQPDTSAYLQKNAFLLIGQTDLQTLLERTTDAQPFLGELVADMSLRGLFSALSLVAEGAQRGIDAPSLAPALGQFHTALADTAAGHPTPLSWEDLLAGPLAQQAGKYRFVLAKPKLDFGALQPGGVATDALRRIAASLPFVKSGQAHVRVTGSVALDDEEFATVAQGAVIGLIGSFLLVLVWLFAAVRSWRLMVAIAGTLVAGLILTTGLAAVAVGTLNLISIAFAILFVGIAVDFGIQFTVRFRERRHIHPDVQDALMETGRQSGSQILVAALATASGFLAFTPTAFVGVAQLGIIAGMGMLIAFFCTLTLLPALLRIVRPRREKREVGVMMLRRLEPILRPLHWPLIGGFLAAAVLGAALIPFIRFDGDPLHTKNQHTESVETLNDLMNDPLTNPYTMQALLPSLGAVTTVTPRLQKVPQVEDVLSLQSFVPENQPAKLAMIADALSVLGPTLAPPVHPPSFDAAALRNATVLLSGKLNALLPKLGADNPLRPIAADLDTLKTAPDETLLAANHALIEFLPMQLDRLRLALSAQPVTLADVPADLKAQWLLPDGRARIQITPKASVNGGPQIHEFVAGVLNVLPGATGSALWIVRSAETIIHAFSIAAISAIAAIAVILALALRRALDVALVMTPLLVSSLLTVDLLMALGIDLNFANIIALPLLLGVGVSFNIYFVMNYRAGVTRFLGSATARAVIFSALTTGTAFGSLALSDHPGTASMGTLLLLSLGSTVLTTLVFVPALLAVMPRPHVLLGGRADSELV
jgi:hopanoid biosynthesis associated RND transporter like protein HpnN